MEYANQEYERISAKYKQLFRNGSQRQIDTNGTIFSYIRGARETREKDWKTATQSIVNISVFFNQCGMRTCFDDIDKMDMDVLFMTYETLVEQEYQKWLSSQAN